jgi:hypothetical protein
MQGAVEMSSAGAKYSPRDRAQVFSHAEHPWRFYRNIDEMPLLQSAPNIGCHFLGRLLLAT